jgi:spore germination protein GerM
LFAQILRTPISSLSYLQPRRRQSSKGRKYNPCAAQVEKILNAMEAADYNIQPLHRYVKDLEECYRYHDAEDAKKGRASTMYYLSQYLDQEKYKKK